MELSPLSAITRKNQINKLESDFYRICEDSMFQQRVIDTIGPDNNGKHSEIFLEEYASNYYFKKDWEVRPRYSSECARNFFNYFVMGNNSYAGDVYLMAQTVKREFQKSIGKSVKQELNEIIRETVIIASAVRYGDVNSRISDKKKYDRFRRLFLSGDFECAAYAANVKVVSFNDLNCEQLDNIKNDVFVNYLSTLLIGRDMFRKEKIKMHLISCQGGKINQLESEFNDQNFHHSHLRLVWDRSSMH